MAISRWLVLVSAAPHPPKQLTIRQVTKKSLTDRAGEHASPLFQLSYLAYRETKSPTMKLLPSNIYWQFALYQAWGFVNTITALRGSHSLNPHLLGQKMGEGELGNQQLAPVRQHLGD